MNILFCTLLCFLLLFMPGTTLAATQGAENSFQQAPPADAAHVPKQQTSPPPAPTKTQRDTRGKYANPYNRQIPLQGDTHKNYSGGKRDPFTRR